MCGMNGHSMVELLSVLALASKSGAGTVQLVAIHIIVGDSIYLREIHKELLGEQDQTSN